MPQQLKKYFLISVAVHILVFGFLWIAPSISLPNEKPYKVTWIQLSRGDGGNNPQASFKTSKNLPQSSIREQKAALQKKFTDLQGNDLDSQNSKNKKTIEQLDSQKRTADKSGVNLNATKKIKSHDSTSDALARIEQQLEQREVDMTVAQANKGESGQSPYGSLQGSNVDPEWVQYYNAIKRKINNEWTVAKGDVSGALIAKVVVLIDANGNVTRNRFETPSGDGSFDESVLRAINRASPFPTPPQSLRAEVLTEGFLFEFNPTNVTGSISSRL